MKKLYVKKLQKTLLLSTIKEDGFVPATSKNIPASFFDISRLLLKKSGTSVCLYDCEETVIDLFSNFGIEYTGTVKLKKGEQMQCHENSSLTLIKHPGKYKLITGFCLNGEIWVRHSWLQDKSGQIIETTFIREKYFGVELKKNMWQRLYFLLNFLGADYIESLPPRKIFSLVDYDVIIKHLQDAKEPELKFNIGGNSEK